MILLLADLFIEVKNKYAEFAKLTSKYSINRCEKIDFSVEVTDEEIKEEKNQSIKTQGLNLPNWYLEFICIYRKIAEILPLYNACVMHGSFLETGGLAFGFLATSGTGKTTHCELWVKLLQDKVRYINGDKPILRILNDNVYVYGTPWCGKEQKENNIKVELKSLCFIERSLTNQIEEISNKDLIAKIFRQIYMPQNQEAATKTIDLLNIILNKSNKYLLKCNMELDAARLSYNTLVKS